MAVAARGSTAYVTARGLYTTSDHNTRGNLVPLALVDEMRLADLATKVFSFILRYGTRRDGAQG